MRALLDDRAALEHDDAVAVLDRSTADARSRSSCGRASARRAPTWISRSDSVSSAEVASSRIRIGASLRIARAIAMRCRCPPESRMPRSPTIVSKPRRLLADEIERVRRRGGALDRLARRVRHRAVGDVRGDRVVEQHDLLRDERDLPAQVGQPDLGQVAAVEQHPAAGRRVEPGNQVDERRLAAARRPDQRHRFAGRDIEVDAVERRRARRARTAWSRVRSGSRRARGRSPPCRDRPPPARRSARTRSRPRSGRAGSSPTTLVSVFSWFSRCRSANT